MNQLNRLELHSINIFALYMITRPACQIAEPQGFITELCMRAGLWDGILFRHPRGGRSPGCRAGQCGDPAEVGLVCVQSAHATLNQ